MVEDIDGVVKDEPVPKTAPPEDDAYQLIVPPLAVADKVKVPASQRLAAVNPVILILVFIDAVTVALVDVVHVAVAASAK